MKTINKIILASLLSTTLLPAIEINSIGVNLGTSKMQADKTDIAGSIALNTSPEENYTHGEIYILVDGFTEDTNIKASLNYINNSNSDIKNNILMVGINKYYKIDDYNVYTGLLLGVAHLEWRTNPMNNTTSNNYTAESIVGALQLGVEYKLDNNIALGLNAKYYISDYTTNLNIGTREAEITSKNNHSLAFGIRYSF